MGIFDNLLAPIKFIGGQAKKLSGIFISPSDPLKVQLIKTGVVAGAGAVALGLGNPVIAPIVVKAAPKIVKAAVPKTIGGALGTIAVSGVLVSSPKARQTAVNLPKTVFTGGKIIGEVIETGKSPLTTGEALLKGGLAAAVVVGGAALVSGAKAIAKGRAPSLTNSQISSPGAIPPAFDVVGIAEQVKEEPKAVVTPTMPTINNRISVKPIINVRVRNTRKKFINQQVLLCPL